MVYLAEAQARRRRARRSQDQRHMSPFAYGAQMSGIEYVGGKPDDITVVVAYVTDAAKL